MTIVDRRREKIRKLFNRIAPRYDAMNRVMSFGIDRRWRRILVHEVMTRAAKNARILDIATGTGDVAIALSRASQGKHRVDGIDISETMLAFARGKIEAAGTAVSLKHAPADRLPFTAGVFGAASVAFGMRNCEDNGKVIAETARVLKTGASFAVLEFFRPDNIFTRLVQGIYVRFVIPAMAFIIARGAVGEYRYLGDSIRDYLSVGEFIQLARARGFVPARTMRFLFGVADLVILERARNAVSPKRRKK